MKASLKLLLCAVFVSAYFFAGCKTYDNDSNVIRQSTNENQNAKIKDIGENQSPAKDDAEELGKLIKIPYQTEEALWKTDQVVKDQNNNSDPAPDNKKLIAVLKFNSADAQKIVEQAEQYRPAGEVSINVESWFPPELIAKSQESGDETIKGNRYAPNDFAQPPYQNGSLTRISGTDYFVLELSAR